MPELYTRRSFSALCGAVALVRPAFAAASEPVTDKLDDWTKHPELKKYAAAFEYLKKTDFRLAQPGRTDLDGDRMYATLSSSKAKLADGGKIETHRKYLDIHYLVEGHELIGTAPTTGLKVIDPYKEANDVEFFQPPAGYRNIDMKPGYFAMFLPTQGHMPGLGTDTSATIRKVVVKVRV